MVPEEDAVQEDGLVASVSKEEKKSERESVVGTTVALCVCMLTHSYLLISVFPYSGFLAQHLLNIKEDSAAQYAGLIASAFMVGRATTSILWGRAADRYGRTFTLYASLILSCIFSILFGMTRSYAAAVLVRFLLGCSNGIMSTIKTVVSEICPGDERTEARTMNLVVGMWGWGFLVSPVVSGALAEPIKQYPGTPWLNEGTLAGDVLREYPFLLPNLLGAAVCLLGIALIRLFVHETLPVNQQQSVLVDLTKLVASCRSYLPGYYRYERLPVFKSHHSDIDMTDESECISSRPGVTDSKPSSSSSMMSILSQKDTRDCLLLYWGYSFVTSTVDEAFPLFCLSHIAGFGIPEKEIGKIMSFAGLVFAMSQYCVSTCVYNYCGGLMGSIKMGTVFSAPVMFLLPLSLLLNRGAVDLRWSTFFFLAILLAFHRSFALVFFSSISVAVNRTVSASNRGAMNGLSMLGGSAAKALGPASAGLLTTLSISWLGRYASLLIFGTVGVLGLIVTWSTFVSLPDLVASNDDQDENEEYEGIVQTVELKEHPASSQ